MNKFPGTILIKHPFYSKLIDYWITESIGSDFIAKLEYQATRDGWNCSKYHSLTDNKGPHLVLIKVKSNGRVFGGFSSLN